MRTCPTCKSRAVSATSTLAASLQSPSYCSNCGSGLVSSLQGTTLIFASALVSIAAGFYFSSYTVGIVTSVVLSCSVLLVPLKARDDDAVAFRKKLGEVSDRF